MCANCEPVDIDEEYNLLQEEMSMLEEAYEKLLVRNKNLEHGLVLIEELPLEDSKQFETATKEMKRIARFLLDGNQFKGMESLYD